MGFPIEHWIIATLLGVVGALLLRWALHVDAHPVHCDRDRARMKERVAALEAKVFDRGSDEEQ